MSGALASPRVNVLQTDWPGAAVWILALQGIAKKRSATDAEMNPSELGLMSLPLDLYLPRGQKGAILRLYTRIYKIASMLELLFWKKGKLKEP